MRCVIYYAPARQTRQEQRLGVLVDASRYILGDGSACNSLSFAKSEMRDYARHLRCDGWRVQGNMRQGYYEAFRGKKHRVLYLRLVD